MVITMDKSFIKLNRKILNWRWYQDANTMRVFIHLLLKSNYKDNDFEKTSVKRGQLITSQSHLAEDLKISVKNVRTALEHLKSTGEVAVQTTAKYSIITINNYNEYQKVADTSAGERQANGRQAAGEGQQYKNSKKEKNIKNSKKREGTLTPLGEFQNVILTQSEFDKLMSKYPNNCEKKIERLSRYMASKGRNFQSHYATLLDWLEADVVTQYKKENSSSIDYDKLNKLSIPEV